MCTLDRKNLIFASSPVIAGSCSVSYFTISVTDFRLDGITKRIIIQSTRVIQKDKSSSILEVRGSWPRPSSSSSLSSLNRLSVGLAVNFETRAQSRQNYVVNKERSIAPITHSLSLSLSRSRSNLSISKNNLDDCARNFRTDRYCFEFEFEFKREKCLS